MAITMAEVARDYETDGVPSSGAHKIKKGDLRSWGAWVEGLISAFTSGGGLIYSSKAALDADLAHDANTMAWVIGDPVAANNGVYGKVGASGTGSWTRRADLPFSFIIASDAGAGTPNAIQATTSIPVSSSALIWTNIFEDNTASPVTISFNGGTPLTIKTNSGNDVTAGGLVAGMIVMGVVFGSTFRILNDQVSSAIVAAAEAAQVAAEAAEAAAEAAAVSVNIKNVADRTALKALDTAVTTLAFLREAGREGLFKWTSGNYSAQVTSDPQEGLYVKATAIAAASGAWVRQGGWAMSGVHVEWFGAVGDGNRLTGSGTVNDTALQAVLDLPYNVLLGYGCYRVTHPIINRIEERLVLGQGKGYIWGEDSREVFSAPTIILATGTAAKRVMTRRKNRYLAGDANDAAMSAVIDNEAAGARYQSFAIELYCDYTNTSPTNYGDDWDIGFFNGCRAHVELRSILVLGYFRKSSFYFDVTRGTGIPELRDYSNVALPVGSDGLSGSDGIRMLDCQCVGGRVGRAILGVATGRTGAAYYDAVTSTTYTDNRGLSGCSDFRSERGTIASVNHHSGYRAADPTGFGAPLTRTNMEAEDDFAPAAQFIDGYAGNTSTTTTGLGCIRGMVFDDFRYLSIEMFRVRHKQCDEINYVNRTWIESGVEGISIRSTSGTIITVTDYNNNTYGHIATDQTYTGSISLEDVTGGLAQTWMANFKNFRGTDAYGRQRAKAFDSGQVTIADDSVASITPPTNGGWMLLAFSPDTTGPQRARSGMVFYDVGASLDIGAFNNGANFAVVTTDVTGTTGVDGNVTVAVQAGVIKIENRGGGTVVIRYTFL